MHGSAMHDISVIIPTVHNSSRSERTQNVILTLLRQEEIRLEIILVVQARPGDKVQHLEGVKTIVSNVFSSSHSRNLGAYHATADVISFLDDDTVPYAGDFYRQIKRILDSGDVDFVTCNIVANGKKLAASRISSDIIIDRRSIIGNMWEPGLSLRRSTFLQFQFDPTLGIGAVHGSGEGFDLGARLLDAGLRGRRYAALEIDHPPLPLDYDFDVSRTFYYSLGNGSSLVARRFYKQYAKQILKQVIKFILYSVLSKRGNAKLAMLRLLCLIIGPMVPRVVPQIVPRHLAQKVFEAETKKFCAGARDGAAVGIAGQDDSVERDIRVSPC
jgi:Glycosyltransferases, probably involved in cell wall biogenesis